MSGYFPRPDDPGLEFVVFLGREGRPWHKYWRWYVRQTRYGQVNNIYTGITRTRIGGLLRIGRVLHEFDAVVRGAEVGP